MTFTEAAAEVLRLTGKPLHFKDITQVAIEKNLLSHVGKTPDVTMGARLSLQIKKEPDGPIVRVKAGVFGLREWEGTGGKKKKGEPKAAPAARGEVADKSAASSGEAHDDASPESSADSDDDDAAADQVAALANEVDAAEVKASQAKQDAKHERRGAPAARAPIDDDDAPILDDDEKMRGTLAATASDLFEEEEDDDQPLLGGPEPVAGGPAGEGGRRRRRRRRRGKGRDDAAPGAQPNTTPTFVAPGAVRTTVAVSTGLGDDDDEETIGVTIGDDRDEQPTRRAIVLERVPAPQSGGRGRGQGFRGQERGDRGQQEGGQERQERGQERGQGFRGSERGQDRNQDRGQQASREPSGVALAQSPAFDAGTDPIDELAGRDLADVAFQVLSTLDRGQGAVAIRAIADAAARRGRLAGDPALATSALSAAMRADNLRRAARGERQRFRLASGGRVSPTDWALSSELLRLEQDAFAAVERYRDGARRALANRLQKDMSGPALVELMLILLERIGFRDIKPVRRAGLPGGENHFSGVHVTAADEIRVAIVLRRDGREIGRERVIDLRGSLHHYGPASAGWLITTGQVLSGAREEASAPGTTPIALFDSVGFARLLEDHDIAVVKTSLAIAFPDLELLENLRNGG